MSFIRKGSTNISVLITRLLLVAIMSLMGSRAALAKEIMVQDAWARASIGKPVNSAGFLKIMNHGKAADKLVAAKADISKKVELHTHIKDGEVMRMRRVKGGIDVPAGGMALLKPGGFHIMFIGLKNALKAGDKIALTLVFEKAGEKTLDMMVVPIGKKAKMMDHSKMDHSKH